MHFWNQVTNKKENNFMAYYMQIEQETEHNDNNEYLGFVKQIK